MVSYYWGREFTNVGKGESFSELYSVGLLLEVLMLIHDFQYRWMSNCIFNTVRQKCRKQEMKEMNKGASWCVCVHIFVPSLSFKARRQQ